MKSYSLDKQVEPETANLSRFSVNLLKNTTLTAGLVVILVTSAVAKKYDKNSYFELEADVQALMASEVANAAPLEIKFIKEKMVLAKKAKAEKKKKLEGQLTEQIRAEMSIAQLRAEVNRLNAELLNKRDQISASEVYLLDLKEQLK